MPRRRLLPEAAYDFWTHDGRDGECGLVRDTMAEAARDAHVWRLKLRPWQRCVITVEWAVNERKVLRLIDRPGNAE